jgi:hypothetical protein
VIVIFVPVLFVHRLHILSNNFENCLDPDESLAIDESIIKFKEGSSQKQYMPKKPIKRGYKIWCLADKSGYLWRFQIYAEKTSRGVEKCLGEKNLMKGLERKNHRLYSMNQLKQVSRIK